jgi:hypothetical protein
MARVPAAAVFSASKAVFACHHLATPNCSMLPESDLKSVGMQLEQFELVAPAQEFCS